MVTAKTPTLLPRRSLTKAICYIAYIAAYIAACIANLYRKPISNTEQADLRDPHFQHWSSDK